MQSPSSLCMPYLNLGLLCLSLGGVAAVSLPVSMRWPNCGPWRRSLPWSRASNLSHYDGRTYQLGSQALPTRRRFSTDVLTAVITPPAVFAGLLVTLWTYKCLMMVVFQNKIIYMPSVPPFSRAEKVEDYASQCRPVRWTEHRLRSADGTALRLLESCMTSEDQPQRSARVVVVYFQGNASSLPPRLPYLSQILKAAHASCSAGSGYEVTMVALSYRGFWKSGGRPSQAGIEMDAEAAIRWVLQRYDEGTKVVLWGQSIGSGVAALAVARLLQKDRAQFDRISGLLLETPFVDLRAILIAMYPQKWLPYRYLAPFLMSTWESNRALVAIGDAKSTLQVFLLQAGSDEIVPIGQAEMLEDVCRAGGIQVKREIVPGALHQDIMMKPVGRQHIVRFIGSFIPG